MREIKFRYKPNYDDSTGFAYFDLHDIAELGQHVMEEYDFCGEYVGQKDENGKEIYSGDILRTPIGIIDIVYFWYTPADFCSGSCVGFMFPGIPHDCEIIGNIYENADLVEKLKGEK